MKKIVVLDGYAANPGDIGWEPWKALGELTVYERTAPEETVERCKDAEIVLTNKVVFDAKVIEALPEQAAGNSFALVLGRNGKVVDFESPAIMEQHGSAQNEARDLSLHDALQAVMLFAFKQFANMGRGILHRPVVVPWLARERRRIDGSVLVQMLNGTRSYYCVLHF